MIELISEETARPETGSACLKVIGVGGAGGNAVNSMLTYQDWNGVQFIVANTDAQALNSSPAEIKIQLGSKVTKGLGAGSNPDIGRRAAEEEIEVIKNAITGADIIFLTAGMGGGTGSGALPVIARAARELGILTVAVVTKPFAFEGKRRADQAKAAISALETTADTIIIVPNQKLLEVADPKISMLDAFSMSNGILNQAVRGIADIIQRPGLINVDFADVRTIMKEMGKAIMGTGRSTGEDRAKEAALLAINSPLLENISIKGAKGILLNITGNTNMGLHEIHAAAQVIYDMVSEDANIILGSVIDPAVGDEIIVTVIATGLDAVQAAQAKAIKQPATEEMAALLKASNVKPAQRTPELPAAEERQLGELAQFIEGVTHEPSAEEQFDTLDTPSCLRRSKPAMEAKNRDEHSLE